MNDFDGRIGIRIHVKDEKLGKGVNFECSRKTINARFGHADFSWTMMFLIPFPVLAALTNVSQGSVPTLNSNIYKSIYDRHYMQSRIAARPFLYPNVLFLRLC